MIVECTNCHTRFQLDDSRIPPRGIRVRCSRCKEAFFLENPRASKAEAANDVASQAARSPRASAEPAKDLRREARSRSPEPDEEEEEDWEFNEGPSGQGEGDDSDEAQVPGLGIDEPGISNSAGERSGLDLASGRSGPALDFDAGDDSSDFGAATDFSLGDAGDRARAEPARDPEAESLFARPAPPKAAAAEVGEPEDWDFFSDESLERPGTAQPIELAGGRAPASVDRPTRSRKERVPVLARPRESGIRDGIAVVGRLIGWSLTLGLFGFGIARGVLHVGAPAKAAPTAVALGVLEAVDVRATWIDTLRSSRVYSVRGRLVNVGSEPRMAGPGVQVVLLSQDGARLEAPVAPAGAPLREEQIRESESAEVASLAATAAGELAAVRVEPGASVEFQAFFEDLPDEAASFVLEMVGTPPVARADPVEASPDEAPGGETPAAEPTASSSASPAPGIPSASLP